MIKRESYLSQIRPFMNQTELIKVIIGVRRSGKSIMLKLIQNELIESGVSEEQIISINLEDLEYEELTDYKKLYGYINERLCKDKYTYIFLDEVQQCSNFEKAVDSFQRVTGGLGHKGAEGHADYAQKQGGPGHKDGDNAPEAVNLFIFGISCNPPYKRDGGNDHYYGQNQGDK